MKKTLLIICSLIFAHAGAFGMDTSADAAAAVSADSNAGITITFANDETLQVIDVEALKVSQVIVRHFDFDEDIKEIPLSRIDKTTFEQHILPNLPLIRRMQITSVDAEKERLEQELDAHLDRLELDTLISVANSADFLEIDDLVKPACTVAAKKLQSDDELEKFKEHGNQYDIHPQVSNKIAQQFKPLLIEQYQPAKNIRTLAGHTGSVLSGCFNHDGTQVLTVSRDNTARIWDARTGACIQTLTGHTNLVLSGCFNHDGTQVLTTSVDCTARIWDATSGACLQTLRGHTGWVLSGCFNHDGTQVLTASGDRTARIWDAASRACIQTLAGHTDAVFSGCFNHDGTQVLTTSGDRTARLWDAITGACTQTLRGHTALLSSGCFNHDGTQVLTASRDNTARIWDARTGACIQTLTGHTSWVRSGCFNHDGTQVLTASGDRTARIWDARTGACIQTLRGHTYWVLSGCFNHDGTQALTTSGDGTARLWEIINPAFVSALDTLTHEQAQLLALLYHEPSLDLQRYPHLATIYKSLPEQITGRRKRWFKFGFMSACAAIVGYLGYKYYTSNK